MECHLVSEVKSTHTVHYFTGYSEATQCMENEFSSKAFATTLDFEFLRDTFKPVARPIFQGWQNFPGGSTWCCLVVVDFTLLYWCCPE